MMKIAPLGCATVMSAVEAWRSVFDCRGVADR